MNRTIFTDYYFDKQPPNTFIEELKTPMYISKPDYYGKRKIKKNEINANGIYIAKKFENDPEGNLDTAYSSFDRFTSVYKVKGERYPIFINDCDLGGFEYYKIRISSEKTEILVN